MITKGDDYPLHQTAEPIAYSGTDRNFYDRYFFNGYSNTGDVFFALGFGIYPHLNIKDSSFCVVLDGVQHNLRASTVLDMERLDLNVGPISIDVVKPLEVLDISVNDEKSGIKAQIRFLKRCPVVKEPRFTHRVGPRTQFDYTRMTQNGSYEGFIEINGKRIDLKYSESCGTRDRSWGVRMIGERDQQPTIPEPDLQLFWLWSPVNFDGFSTLYGTSADKEGLAWHDNMVIIPQDESKDIERLVSPTIKLYNYKPGTRHLENTQLEARDNKGELITLTMTPRYNFYMSGLGYFHPEWGHGLHKGRDACTYDSITLSDADPLDPNHRHIQAFVDVVFNRSGQSFNGVGVLEQLIIGPHLPSGLGKDPVLV
ncbi:hypothetical protein [Zhongshania sp.]|jgi:hypothetical protein|uniref:hypothetical protein n=1 Tax=Zhongshania sp. TaxID=1971902 RepID=UPI002A80AB83|nr:hypothetical protein [Zhongshania sp.]